MIKKIILLTVLTFLLTGCNVAKNYNVEKINLEVEGGTIYGTITIPKGDGPFSIAIIHPGSGPTDRDGNSNIGGDNNSLKMLAEALGQSGIASIRYDKRGIAESMDLITKEEEMVFEDYIKDLNLWIDEVRNDSRFNKVIIIGHSEGALIGGQAAAQSNVDGFISLAGAGYSAYDTLIRQLATQPKEITDITTPILEELMKGNLVENVPQELYSLFRPSVQPYLISWFKYDPVQVYKAIEAPILIIQGDNDIQVTVEDAQALHSAKDSKLVIIEGMNHVLKDSPRDVEGNIKTYSDPKLQINDEIKDEIIEFILGLNK